MHRIGGRRRLHLSTLALLVTAALATPLAGGGAPPAAAARRADPVTTGTLPLGAAGVAEVRTTRTLQPGVTLTRIFRGVPDPADVWTVDVGVPRGAGSPDPDAATTPLSGAGRANRLAADLTALGFAARVEQVTTPPVADYAGGLLGNRVRVGSFTSKAQADAERARLGQAGVRGSTTFTGWDGRPDGQGPWRAYVLTIDPRTFRGGLAPSYGSSLLRTERTSALVTRTRARAGINAGFFVLDPAAGGPGDPAGVGVYGGRVQSEAVNGRPGLVVTRGGRSSVVRLVWRGSVRSATGAVRLDGVNRVPGLVRSCGGVGGDSPTERPEQDVTCTDPDEIVAFTGAWSSSTPRGVGLEVFVDRRGVVSQLRPRRGGRIPPGGFAVQATGSQISRLLAISRKGRPMRLRSALATSTGTPFRPSVNTGVVNGGPVLVQNGQPAVTAAQDGFARSATFYYGFSAKRNPRTFAGRDAQGRTILAVVDGRSTASLGVTLEEESRVAASLGMTDAVNLDGGGSSTMVVGKRLANRPSDPSGERAVGDSLLVLRHR